MTHAKTSSFRFVRSAATVLGLLAGCSGSTANPLPPDADGGVDAAPPMVADLIHVEEPKGSTSKSGGQATFRVRLKTPPDADVRMEVASRRDDLAAASPAKLVFTSVDWWDPQTVTVTGVNNYLTEGHQSYGVQLGPTLSTDPRFDGLRPPNIQIFHIDDNQAGLIVLPPSGLTTHESGGSTSFSVQLATRPTASVILTLGSDNPMLGTVSPWRLVFSPDTWNVAQQAEVSGHRDSIATGDVTYHIVAEVTVPITDRSNLDRSYLKLPPTNVPVLSIEDDKAGFLVTPTSGLVTRQDDVNPGASFTVALTSQPTAKVTVAVSSSNTDCGTVAPASLTFTASDWNQPRKVELTGVDNKIAADLPYVVRLAPAVSADPAYSGFDPPDVAATNVSIHRVGIRLFNANALTTTELGGTARFAITLTSRPTAPVTVSLTSSRPEEGLPLVDSVVFQPDEWSTPHPIEVRGVADNVEDGDQLYAIRVGPARSGDPGYDGFEGTSALVTNIDAHAHYLTVRRLTVNASANLDGATADLDKLVFHDNYQVYVLDVAGGYQTLVSQSSTGVRGNDRSFNASLSADGRFIVFTSAASNLVAGDTNGKYDVYLRDVQAGTTTRVSMGRNGEAPTDESIGASISDDGRWVAYSSRASNLVGGDSNSTADVFIWNRMTGETTRMLGPGGVQPNGGSTGSRLSADGRYVTFVSDASNLVANDTNGSMDAFVWDRTADLITRVSVSSAGAQCTLAAHYFFSISDDGQVVGFTSGDAATLDPPSANYEGEGGAYIHDLRTGRTRRVVVGEDGTPLPHRVFETHFLDVAANGRFVGFVYNRPAKAFVYDVAAARSRRVVLNGWDVLTAIPSNDGKRVVFDASPESPASGPLDLFIASRP